ncbi:lysophospholipid acyltransferase family protein [Anaerovorax odorimutans]|uniref:lysophospholipid acyltransferase family protein n=1 Tax=Anaerovorax odorimutans TaxID=109327 RepID=UPI0003FF5034|nr:lysophospholipid acyltransferase family protein [Anaerovorax odorimutans]
MKKILKNIEYGIWMYWELISLAKYNKNIKKYRDLGDFDKERTEILKSTSKWGNDIVKKLGIQLTVTGLENIPKDRSVVFVSNHQGYGDIPIFGAAITNKQLGFVAKRSLGQLPLYGKWIQDIRSVFIERDDPRESLKAIDRGIELLKNGFSLGIFAEGTRSKGPEMGSFKKGSLRLATKPGVPVVPITLNGTWRIFEENGYASPAKVDFFIHPAIETKGMSKLEANNLSERVEKIIKTKLDELNKDIKK